MNKQTLYRSSFYLTLVFIIGFSFFHHSSLYSPFLNSDDAVVALMIHKFSIPQDLYYWGSNRFGSLIPLIGQFFYKVLHFTPIQSEAISHYSLLILGFLGFASLFKTNAIRLIFAVVWFLPPLRMIDVLKLSQGEQYALIGISVFLISKLISKPFDSYRLKEHIILILITLIFITSAWVSDLAVVTISIILIFYGVGYLRTIKTNAYASILKKPELYYILFGFISGALFIYYAKSKAVKVENYYDFFDLKTSLESVKIFMGTIRDLFLFRIKEPFTSLYSYLLLGGIIILILNHRKIKLTGISSKWATIFLLDLILIFLIILSARWTYLNGVPRRYFVCSYVSFWIVFLLCVENIQSIKYKWLLNAFVALTLLVGGLGTIYNYKYISPKSLKPTIALAAEFGSLGKIGVVSEYWNSYINAAPDPDNIKTTPNDKSEVRNQSLVDSVFSQSQLYINRDMWMDSFPDTLEQFGYILVKDGIEFRLAGSHVCKYRKIKLDKTFNLADLKYNPDEVLIETESDRLVLHFSPYCIPCKDKYVVFGPYMPIGIGSFKARFYVKSGLSENMDRIALLDVAADWGMAKLMTKDISKSDFDTVGNFQYIDLDFETSKRYSNIEFRILYYGNSDLYFDHVRIVEK